VEEFSFTTVWTLLTLIYPMHNLFRWRFFVPTTPSNISEGKIQNHHDNRKGTPILSAVLVPYNWTPYQAANISNFSFFDQSMSCLSMQTDRNVETQYFGMFTYAWTSPFDHWRQVHIKSRMPTLISSLCFGWIGGLASSCSLWVRENSHLNIPECYHYYILKYKLNDGRQPHFKQFPS